MRSVLLLVFALSAAQGVVAQTRFDPVGLSGRIVYDLAQWGEKLYAATDDGVYLQVPTPGTDSAWIPCGLQGKRVRTIYPHPSGALGYALTAGIEHRAGGGDSAVIYCSENSDSSWVEADDGISRSLVRMIRSIDGFPSPEVCGETYAASEGLLFRREIGGIWEKVFDLGIVTTNVVRVHPATVSVWVGGETTIFAPFISRSDDMGETWTTFYPDLQGDNACDALAFDPFDTSVVYAGMEGAVIVSVDGGKSWASAGLAGTPFYFFGLEVNTATGRIFAGGAAHGGLSGLFAKDLDGALWTEFSTPQGMPGIRTILPLPAAVSGERLLLGTDGSGVVCFSISPCSVAEGTQPEQLRLYQNYPNPFNPATTIAYSLPVGTYVTLKVFDLLGREVATVHTGRDEAGRHARVWNARGMPSGVYFARLATARQSMTKTMLLSR